MKKSKRRIKVQEGTSRTPADDFHSEKLPGGFFVPSSQTYSLQNTGGSPIDWTLTKTSHSDEFLLSKTSGTLLNGQVDSVTVSVNADYPFTPGIIYSDMIYFNNTTNSQGNTSRVVDAIFIFQGKISLEFIELLLLSQ